LPFGKDWEAGATPALPRNCKRGHRSRPPEELWEGRLPIRMHNILTREPGDRRNPSTATPFA